MGVGVGGCAMAAGMMALVRRLGGGARRGGSGGGLITHDGRRATWNAMGGRAAGCRSLAAAAWLWLPEGRSAQVFYRTFTGSAQYLCRIFTGSA